MPERPEPHWTVEDYERWMLPAFDELANKWSSGGDRPAWLDDCDRAFLETLGVTESEVESQPDLRVLQVFLTKLEDDYSDDEGRRSTLLDERARDELIQDALDETAADGGAEPAGADSILNLEWVTTGQQAELGDGWDTYLWAKLDEVWPEWRDVSDTAPLVDWLESWLPSLLEERSGAGEASVESGTAAETESVDAELSHEEIAAKVGQQIAAPALADALAAPQLAGVAPEEISRRVSAVVAQRAASAAR